MKKVTAGLIVLLFTLPVFAQLNAEQTAIKKYFLIFLDFIKRMK